MPSHGSVAKSVRLSKESHPENYCPAAGCLWRTFDASTGLYKGCPKGAGHGVHPDVLTAAKSLHDSMAEGIAALHANAKKG